MIYQDSLLDRVRSLISAHRAGLLGGERMPEDQNPGLERSSSESYMYFTLPMALNYQRNSYALWECANRAYHDESARWVFDSGAVCRASEADLRECLVRHRVALQPHRHPAIWRALCVTVERDFDGDIRDLFRYCDYSVKQIKSHIAANKKSFPYLGGDKICNYWLCVLERYTDIKFADRENITVAPDTHVIQSSVRLGIISDTEAAQSDVQALVADRWRELLAGTGTAPIDLHTPLWLWSRGKFAAEI